MFIAQQVPYFLHPLYINFDFSKKLSENRGKNSSILSQWTVENTVKIHGNGTIPRSILLTTGLQFSDWLGEEALKAYQFHPIFDK
jgi:hypothetical protein